MIKRKDTAHSFDLADVEKYGSIEKALIIKEIRSMNMYKIRNNEEAWVYYSNAAIAEKFPYMKARSITRWLEELEHDGHLKSAIKNKVKYDRTKSYVLPEYDIPLAKMANGETQSGSPIPPHSSPQEINIKDVNGETPTVQVLTKAYGNTLVNWTLKEFEKAIGFEPTDRKPRFATNNFIRKVRSVLKARNVDPTDRKVAEVTRVYFQWVIQQDWSEGVQTIDVLRRKVPVFIKEAKL